MLNGSQIDAYVGPASPAALSVQRLGSTTRGQVGLWVGNGSNGVFTNLQVTPR